MLTIYLLVLHPGHKLTYFKKQRWPENWQKLARSLLTDTYTALYAGRFGDDNQEDEDEDGDCRGGSGDGDRGAEEGSGSEMSDVSFFSLMCTPVSR